MGICLKNPYSIYFIHSKAQVQDIKLRNPILKFSGELLKSASFFGVAFVVYMICDIQIGKIQSVYVHILARMPPTWMVGWLTHPHTIQ